ncbi:MAG TPA: energy transducer TonB [Methylocella sp.]|nr:energy transducer TonB [Methylocella sp.]
MSSALASASVGLDDLDPQLSTSPEGAQILLLPIHPKPSPWTRGGGAALYAALLAAGLLYAARPQGPVEDQAIELVMLPPVAEEEPPPPPPPLPPPEEEPPPPVAEEPVAPKPPLPPPKPKPKVVAKPEKPPVAHAPAEAVRSGPTKVPPNAIASSYANQIHSRIAHAAVAPHGGPPHQLIRVGYRLVISPSGAVISKSISPSGNAVFDSAATQALVRAAPFPATGMTQPVALSGAIVFK